VFVEFGYRARALAAGVPMDRGRQAERIL